VYAAGVIFYQLLTGSLPEWKRGLLQPNEAFADIPQHLRTLVTGMLCRDIKVRLSNFEDVKKGLSLLQDNSDEKTRTAIKSTPEQQKPAKHRRSSLLATALILLVVINGGLYLWLYAQKQPLPDWLAAPLVQLGVPLPHPAGQKDIANLKHTDAELTLKRVENQKQN